MSATRLHTRGGERKQAAADQAAAKEQEQISKAISSWDKDRGA